MLEKNVPLVQLFLFLLNACRVYTTWLEHNGPWVFPTSGEPWPMPAYKDVHEEIYKIQLDGFDFQIKNEKCDILDHAIKRYREIISDHALVAKKLARSKEKKFNKDYFANMDSITGLQINLKYMCQSYPYLHMNESYELTIPDDLNDNIGSLKSDSIWGILRGLETFSQIISTTEYGLLIKKQRIIDYPKLPHRGLLIDTGRHFLPVKDILRILDGMSYNKLNVLHWHIVDDNSFPYQSQLYPELSKKGAYHWTMVYTPKELRKIVEYARLRGIRVIPEFDTPGHSKSWGLSHPEFLTTCYDENEEPNGSLGPIDPTNTSFYDFFFRLFSEIKFIFPDTYFHLGGDEVSHDCWKSNPNINKFMKDHNFSHNYHKLEELHYKATVGEIGNTTTPIVWQEVFENVEELIPGTVIQIWTGNWRDKMAMVTNEDYKALLSACWYLDHIAIGPDWIKFYNCDPLDFEETFPGQKENVIGGEACMWGEFVDKYNVHTRIWPRACAAAERLWSIQKDNILSASERLEEHSCRMNIRGISTQPPNGPGFCIT